MDKEEREKRAAAATAKKKALYLGGLHQLWVLRELLCSHGLRLLRQILDLGLSENDMRVRRGALEHIWLLYHEQDVLALLYGNARHSGHLFHAQLGYSLS